PDIYTLSLHDALPIFQLYDQTYSSVNVSSNGRLDFVVPNEPGGFITNCLPAPPNVGPYDFTVFSVWQDQRTDFGLSGCSSFPGGDRKSTRLNSSHVAI